MTGLRPSTGSASKPDREWEGKRKGRSRMNILITNVESIKVYFSAQRGEIQGDTQREGVWREERKRGLKVVKRKSGFIFELRLERE